MLKALLFIPNKKTTGFGSLVALARAEDCKHEHTERNPTVRALRFFPELNVYVTVYETRQSIDLSVRSRG